jgi:HlyD family secretion protein
MDVPRKSAARNRLIKRVLMGVVALTAMVLITIGLGRLKLAAPTIERSSVWIDTVKRGPMRRDVRGLGTLVPQEILFIPALTDGRVVRIHIRPGTAVKPDSVILELSNPELETAAVDAEFQLKAAEAAYTDLRVQLESKGLDQRATAAQVTADFKQARMKADRDEALAKQGLLPDLDRQLSRVKAEELAVRTQLEEKRLSIVGESVEAQLAAQRVKIDQLRAQAELKRKQVEQLKVRAGTDGILQQLPVEVGQRLAAGTVLAKVSQPTKLKAELKVPETQAKDIGLGQPVTIDTRNGLIAAKVIRIDPGSTNGTVTVDAKLEGELPQGARPDLSVDGTVELERLSDVVYVGRPVFGQPNSTVSLFKLEPDGRYANRVQVKLGRNSVNNIEIVEGLRVGDQVILSDMSAWDAQNRIRLN